MKAKIQSQVQNDRLVLEEAIPLALPLVVYLEPSGYCNLKCKFCPHGACENGLKKDLMSLDLFKKLVGDMLAFPGKVKLLRVCGNGDPLMNKSLLPMLEYVHRQRAVERIELITNGLLLTPELIENLPHFVNRLVFSVEGLNCEEYQRYCGTKVDFQKLLNDIDAVYASCGQCVVHVKTHHHAVATEEKQKEFLSLFARRCHEIFIEKLVPMWPQLDIEFSTNQFRWGCAEVVPRRVCAQIFKGIQVQADGEVVPCCVDWKRVNVLGNIRHESLRDIWNGPRMHNLQLAHLSGAKERTEPCRDCTMNDFCEVDNIDAHAQACMERLGRETAQ
jgi:radical SAM protein with 4Fe4S-binding SPASM domain